MYRWFLLVFLLATGCTAVWVIKNPDYPDAHTLSQDHSLDTIRSKIASISSGMSQREVLAILGRPSIVYHNGWSYYDTDDSGVIFLNSERGMIVIRFDARAIVVEVEDVSDASEWFGTGSG